MREAASEPRSRSIASIVATPSAGAVGDQTAAHRDLDHLVDRVEVEGQGAENEGASAGT